MIIGLLLCDEVAPVFIEEHGTYQSMFERLIPDLQFNVHSVFQNDFPQKVTECDAYLVNGSRHSVYDDIDWIHRLKEFTVQIYAEGKPYVGVCFGHQLLAEALGGKVQKSTNGWSVGIHNFTIDQAQEWMQPPATNLNLLMMCQDQVSQLPSNCRVLASTSTCPIGMFLVNDRMLGIQAHPEFSREYDAALIRTRKERIGTEKAKQALENLDQPLHSGLIALWISNFFHKHCD